MTVLSRRWRAWRHLGPRRGSAVAATRAWRTVRGPCRSLALRAWPLRVGHDELAGALGRRSAVEALRGPARVALGSVARWEEELHHLPAPQRTDLDRRARDIVEHRFDLLGSGPVELGHEIDWQRDFKSGRSWPLSHISRVQIAYPDQSDIKVPWELSRFQHLPLLAAAFRVNGERHYLEEIGAQLEHWIDHNPVEFGANWACTMDVAIRAANWVAALVLCAEDAHGEPWLDKALASLLLHGRFIRSHLEYGPARGNHYLSDIVGLQAVAGVFSSGEEGRAWAGWAARELIAEMDHQVRPDGCDHEASISYHRLVCELFLAGTEAADALTPGLLPASYRERLQRMLGFVADYTRPDGLAPQIGDADSGRYLPLGDYGSADQRSHRHLLAHAKRSTDGERTHAAYPDGGYYVMRAGDLYMIVRCGDVGLYGVGCHAHNDQLSFELARGGEALVVDPGTYLYTADPRARNEFRSTAFHSALEIGATEQNELSEDRLFAMADRTQARTLAWEASGRQALFEGSHEGYRCLSPPASHRRRIEFDGGAGRVRIVDTVVCTGSHKLRWTFPLAPCQASEIDGGITARYGRACLRISAPGLRLALEDGWYSPAYGVRLPTVYVRGARASRPGEDAQEFLLQTGFR